VDGFSASFEAGRVTALIGPNGAGKTTLFHLISGALTPDEGEILLGEMAIQGLRPWEVARLGVGRLFQDVRVFPRLSVLENLLVANSVPVRSSVPLALIKGGRAAQLEEQRALEARRWLEVVGLEVDVSVPAGSLSYGQQKLLAMARLLATGAQVLLLDEPTSGIHPSLVTSLLRLIRKLAEEGRTVILIEHNMPVVLEVSDWVYFMDEGQVAAFGLPREVLSDDRVQLLYLGL
jgi:ABC-type branched-subunit amino acid transport system ATPase component